MNQKLNNTCIKCESVEHGKEIVKFYKDNGWDNFASGGRVGDFYGIFDGGFNIFNSSYGRIVLTIQEAKDLVKENQYPKVMWVKNELDTQWVRRVVFAYKCGQFISWVNAEKLEDAEAYSGVAYWNLAKDTGLVETEFKTKTRERIAAIEKELEELKKLVK